MLQYYTGGGCVAKIAYGFVCSDCNYTNCPNCNQCSQCQDYSNGYCNPNNKLCTCVTGAFYDVGSSLCLRNASFNQKCLSSTQCDTSKGLTCSNNGTCACKQSGYYYSSYIKACLLCSWTIVSYDNAQTCIKDFSSTYPTAFFSTSQNYCASFGAHILRLDSSALNSYIKSFLLKRDLFYWLDATDLTYQTTFVWNSYTGSPGYNLSTNIIPWCPNQPDGGLLENCLALAPMNWCLVDVSCTAAQLYVVCQYIY